MTRTGALIFSSFPLAAVLAVPNGGAPALQAQQLASQAVVTPDDPIWAGAQEPQDPPAQAGGDQAPGEAVAAAAAATSRAPTTR